MRQQAKRTTLGYVGTAGWSIPRAAAEHFPVTGTHLQRYAQVFNCVEINSSFYRPHAEKTYRRWAESTPPSFRFAVKMPRSITHESRLTKASDDLARFIGEVNGLDNKLGVLLVQLPPSLVFDMRVASSFFAALRKLYNGPVACEPRQSTWFVPYVDKFLTEHAISRVAADPSVVPIARDAGGATKLIYFRLHGSPRMYWSSYSSQELQAWKSKMANSGDATSVWIIFDNTAAGFATDNALEIKKRLAK